MDFLLLASSGSRVRCELVQSQPARARSKTWVKTPFSSTGDAAGLAMQRISAVGDSGVAQHAHRDHALLQVDDLVLAGDQKGQLLVARGDVAGGRDIHEQGRKHQLQGILIAQIDGVDPRRLQSSETRRICRTVGGGDGTAEQARSRSAPARRQQESRKTEKPAGKRVIRTMNSTSGVRGQGSGVGQAVQVKFKEELNDPYLHSMIALGLGWQRLGKHENARLAA